MMQLYAASKRIPSLLFLNFAAMVFDQRLNLIRNLCTLTKYSCIGKTSILLYASCVFLDFALCIHVLIPTFLCISYILCTFVVFSVFFFCCFPLDIMII